MRWVSGVEETVLTFALTHDQRGVGVHLEDLLGEGSIGACQTYTG